MNGRRAGVLVELVLDLARADPEDGGGLGGGALARLQGAQDGEALQVVDGGPGDGGDGGARRLGVDRGREVARLDAGAVAEHHGALHRVLQLAHVAGPAVGGEGAQGVVGEGVDALAVLLGVAAEEEEGQLGDVADALAERGDLQGDHVEAVVEILAEEALGDALAQVAVGGGEDAHVDLEGLVAAHALEGALLEEAEQLDLGGQRDLAHLVEEDGAAGGQLEAPLAAGDGAGERALLVAEELALQQGLAERRAVEAHQRRLGAGAGAVDHLGDQLLAGAGLALDEDAGAARRHLLDHPQQLDHAGVRADDVPESVALAEPLAQPAVLLHQAGALHGALDHHRQHREIEGLGEVVVGALLHRLDGVGDGAEGGHHHEGRVALGGLGLLHQADAVEARHLQVGEDHVGLELLELAERLEAVGRRLGAVALLTEDLREGRPCVGLVVHDQDPPAGCHGDALAGFRRGCAGDQRPSLAPVAPSEYPGEKGGAAPERAGR